MNCRDIKVGCKSRGKDCEGCKVAQFIRNGMQIDLLTLIENGTIQTPFAEWRV